MWAENSGVLGVWSGVIRGDTGSGFLACAAEWTVPLLGMGTREKRSGRDGEGELGLDRLP